MNTRRIIHAAIYEVTNASTHAAIQDGLDVFVRDATRNTLYDLIDGSTRDATWAATYNVIKGIKPEEL